MGRAEGLAGSRHPFLKILIPMPAKDEKPILNKVNRYAIYHRLHTAKRPETRAKRMKDFLAMLTRGEKLH